MAPVFTIRDGMKAQLDLCINNLLHRGVFDAGQLFLPDSLIVHIIPRFEKVIRAEQGA